MNQKNLQILGIILLVAALLAGIYAVVQARETGQAEEETAQYREENLSLQENLERLEEELEEIRQENQRLSQEKDHYRDRVEELEEGSQFLEEELVKIEEEIEELEQQKRRLLEEKEDYQQEIRELEAERNRLARELQDLKDPDPGTPPPAHGEVAYLTFDDGPSPQTEDVLDILKDYQVPATFFVIGRDNPFGHRMYRRIVEEGHALGNHTYSHDYSRIYQSPQAFMEDFYRLEELLARVAGVRPDIMRFPGGSRSASALETAGYDVIGDIIPKLQEEGYTYFDWNVTSGDSATPPPDKDQIVENVLGGARGRRDIVVLFHDSPGKEATVEALPEIIEGLKDMGYSFQVLKKDGFQVQFDR
ncbi:MAG: hypothetical protein D5R97_04975 [Candidatus Syntrophonatronum acetioxidans]|uniref:NodB homology domain-containing protein n=1 Tax=Candidatus Syntrophonatronum acetioxidans TaxID=1795816 RepID=A0A424YES5_9FIRM|nr:MAG: hypothetical protein D5R97_04975 [Candidatus Syntrophonatronum acetioxidans]